MITDIRKTVFLTLDSPQATDHTVKEYLSACGTVIGCEKAGTGGATPIWKVMFTTEEGVANALRLDGREFLGEKVTIQSAINPLLTVNAQAPDNSHPVQRTVHVTNICSKLSEKDVAAFFQQYGPVTYVKIAGDDDKPSRFCFIEFATVEAAMQAMKFSGVLLKDRPLTIVPSTTPIIKPEVSTGTDSLIKVSKEGATQQNPQNEFMTAIARTIYAANVDSNASEEELFQHFNQSGPVTYIKLAGDDRKPARFAFVEYMDPAGAFTCLTTLANKPFRDRPLKLQQSTSLIIKPVPNIPTKQDCDKLEKILQRIARRRSSSESGHSDSEDQRERQRERRDRRDRRRNSTERNQRDRRGNRKDFQR
eukprot:TRINITY_DN10946_c0_g1_i1.p1 TRINITY_DN10946_c0_g1~~TRINITY_DN10946_c0_g1_i1.p1  ORF type:complete len:364 (+),score=52.01 TRINITY_DN10946_c0_g1_i1:213-1304(+)